MTAYRSNTRRKESLRRGDLLTDRSAPELNQANAGPGWGSVALRTTAVVAGIATVAAIVRAGQRRTGNGQAHANGVNGANGTNAMSGEPEVERSITIACSADELYQKWRDPQTLSEDVLSYGDLIETGDLIGPRLFSTGPGIFSRDPIASLDGGVFGRLRKNPSRPAIPATRPISTATMKNGAA
jgi:hypothetical protein